MQNPVPTDLSIEDLFRGDLQLASPPNIYFELKKTSEDPTKTLTDAGKIIEKDPGLTARLLKIVNSAFFGFPTQIATVTHAITLIGLKELEDLVLGTLIIDKFSSMPNGLISMHDFWEKSLRCALIAKEISEYQTDYDASETIFICGLLHELGQLVFFRRIPTLAREVGLQVDSTGTDEIITEQKLIGFDHYQTGAELTRLWKLPEIIVTTILHHSDPENAGNFKREARMVKQASLLSRSRIFDSENFALNDQFSEFSIEDLQTITQQANTKFEEIFNIFYPV